MQFVSAVQKAGVDAKELKYITAQDGAGMSMLLGKKADVYSTGVGEAAEQARAGKVRVLAITAPERMKGDTVKDFPTLKKSRESMRIYGLERIYGTSGNERVRRKIL